MDEVADWGDQAVVSCLRDKEIGVRGGMRHLMVPSKHQRGPEALRRLDVKGAQIPGEFWNPSLILAKDLKE